jgi:hypothetical protein
MPRHQRPVGRFNGLVAGRFPASKGSQARYRSVFVSSANGVPRETCSPGRASSSAPHPDPTASVSTGSASAIASQACSRSFNSVADSSDPRRRRRRREPHSSPRGEPPADRRRVARKPPASASWLLRATGDAPSGFAPAQPGRGRCHQHPVRRSRAAAPAPARRRSRRLADAASDNSGRPRRTPVRRSGPGSIRSRSARPGPLGPAPGCPGTARWRCSTTSTRARRGWTGSGSAHRRTGVRSRRGARSRAA